MKRQDKYPTTESFYYYNANPKGRTTAGDCVIRAICTALGQSWEDTLQDLTAISLKNGYAPNDSQTYREYLSAKGYTMQKQPRKEDNTKYTGQEWCAWVSINEPHDRRFNGCAAILAHIGGHHMVCIKPSPGDGFNRRFKVNDTWDSTHGCIGNYWVIR